ncbi:2-dehydropantoate 2-reductase [Bifidobacterium crudilactis]|uniref:2-dehydropantoate 2-reductase n=1 Tax=Bifidobacterium crudilactis TaxID=327277 RepID=UPI0026471D46|nr:2-dehydropantoate 2-reductase [Bifidobacterium crudilactis]MDN5972373.1 2-dehydropantoate 2-reductase [Bifidobacterium crudilactis]MDN6000476.1 2-dehydropantoate 2-reductase [Bifidobacterium crudilactis]MDN6208764.1 2-dehydropantoate 2-reductase [Bifidobacterium crudilactis]MDN6233797.1 2-dehydropantoate 2-reductase [Bifidobacterium crudilactis]MDN6271594.1 2-dehydropantoate 2-reductase [Bifidobacterium crudilactis]
MTRNNTEDTVALIGAGAIGLSIASAYTRIGAHVVVCGGHTPIERISVTEGEQSQSWPVTHTDDPSAIAGIKTVILAVKAHQTESAASWITAAASPSTTILVAQNGIEHARRVSPHSGESHIVPAIVYLNVERTEPGHALLRRAGDHDLSLPDTPAARRMADELSAGGMRMRLEDDFPRTAWLKLLVNLTANPLTALTGRRAEVIREPGITELARQIMREAQQVAQAEGVHLEPSDVETELDWLMHVPAGSTSSMRQDRLAGKPLEYDALTGAVVRAAERHGIDTPANRMILALLAAIRPA